VTARERHGAFDPTVAARIAESGIPMSANYAPITPEQAAREGLAAYEKHPELGFACCSAHTAADTVPALLAENARLRRELDAYKDELDSLHRNTLPELRREIQHHQDGKKQWRDRAEKAEPERDALRDRLHQIALVKVWTNEDGKRFVFADDIAHATFGIEPKPEVER
jgi:predicted RNase H-like nuclease (RuvC/YqgF family)